MPLPVRSSERNERRLQDCFTGGMFYEADVKLLSNADRLHGDTHGAYRTKIRVFPGRIIGAGAGKVKIYYSNYSCNFQFPRRYLGVPFPVTWLVCS